MMRKNILLEYAHALLRTHVTKDDIVVDATMGNGHDTLFLAQIAKEVYAFDIQLDAMNETSKKTHGLDHVHLILDSHEHILNYVTDFKGIIFNLGYLPQGDQSITTLSEVTLKTLKILMPALKKDGFIQIVSYPGHPEGKVESELIQEWLKTLPPYRYQIIQAHFQNQDNHPPYLVMITKIKDES